MNKFVTILTFLASVAIATILTGSQPPDTDNCMWHVRLVKVWGQDNHGNNRNIDIYTIFEEGNCVSTLATSRRWNKSVHVVEPQTLKLDGHRISGKLDIILTPDAWVPEDRQPRRCPVEFEGKLESGAEGKSKQTLKGSYKIVFEGNEIRGPLAGGIEAIERGFGDNIWTASLNQVVSPGSPRVEEINVYLGLLNNRIQWASMGHWIRARRGYSGYKRIPVEIEKQEVTPYIVSCETTVAHRLISPCAEPSDFCKARIKLVRVQGLVGGRAEFTLLDDKEEAGESWWGYGRGKVSGKTPTANPHKEILWHSKADLDPWFKKVEGFEKPKPGEHPRLFFRKRDIPKLRKRAKTETGQEIISRLRTLLGNNGEAVPARFNKTPPHNHMKSPDLPVGETFTSFHAPGFGFLYVLTGEKKYAEYAKECVNLMFAGKMDRDNRYGWRTPGTLFRAGSVLTSVATAYDFCYNAWPKDFRRKVALSIQNYSQKCAPSGGGKAVTLKLLAGRTGYPPSSNHYGAHMGAGTAVLAILGDPGTDTERLKKRLKEFQNNIPRILSHGFGDHGFYAEGHHPGRISSNCGLSEFLMALRCAGGRDCITVRPNSQWMALQWVMHLVGDTGFPHRGPYGGNSLDGKGMSHSGDIAYGFGIIEDKYKPALLWTYENCIKPVRHNYGANTYPHRAVHAFLNWPIGRNPVNPAKIISKAVVDKIHGYFMCRNRWKNGNDILLAHFKQAGPQGYHRIHSGGKMIIWGLGVRTSWSTGFTGSTTFYSAAEDGSIITAGGENHLAVDFSTQSGSPLMVAGLGPAFRKDRHRPVKKGNVSTAITEVRAGGRNYVILTLQEGKAPKPVAKGERVKIGGQSITFDGTRLWLEHWDE